jgi:hypothetical protein
VKTEDLIVEVRDKTLARVGVIRPEELDLEVREVFNNVGSWKITLASEHPLAPVLRTPGSGLIVSTIQDVLISGPTISSSYKVSADDPTGAIAFEGVSDDIVLADRLAFPDPANLNPTGQTKSHDIRTGKVETIIHGFVNANAGPSAPVSRRVPYLIMGTNGARGATVTKSARFTALGELIGEIAANTRIGFRVVQRDANLVFETREILDRSGDVRLDVRNGSLESSTVAIGPPGATQVIVAGDGEGTDRQFYQATTTEATAAEVAWGRRIERFVDQRQTDDQNEYIEKAAEVLEDEGRTLIAVQAVPGDDNQMVYGIDWTNGDLVTVLVENQETTAIVTGFVVKSNSNGTMLGAFIGDPSGFDIGQALNKRIVGLESRVDYLERSDIYGVPQTVSGTSTTTVVASVGKKVDITFGQTFRTIPAVVACLSTNNPTATVQVTVNNITVTGFELWFFSTQSQSLTATWFAHAA